MKILPTRRACGTSPPASPPCARARADGGDIPETPRGVDRTRCGVAGCHRRFHRLRYKDVKHALQRHYCAVCQRVVCHAHTRYAAHGPFSSCGMESQCICEDCFDALPRGTQARRPPRQRPCLSGAGRAHGRRGRAPAAALLGRALHARSPAASRRAIARGGAGASSARARAP